MRSLVSSWVVTLTLAGAALGVAACSGGSGNSSGAGGGGLGGAGSGAGGAGAGGAATTGSGGAGTTGAGGRGGAGTGTGGSGTAGAGGVGSGGAGGAAGRPAAWTPSFETRTLSTLQFAEGADVGDINGDGVLDLVAGPDWYAGPTFALGGTVIANPPSFPMDQYSTFFLTFVDDLSGDGRPDVIAISDAGIAVAGAGANVNARWYENPGPSNLTQPWAMHALFDALVSNESPAYVNLVGDAKKELVFMTNRQLGYAQPGATPTAVWTFHAIGGNFNTPYVHGLGVGDVDGDGLADVVERTGWWRQVPAAGGGLPTWESHPVDFAAGANKTQYSNWGGAQMYVYDVDGDGDSDVVTALAAHQYGLSWFEQAGSGASATFTPHVILPAAAGAGNFSQLHAMAVADLNGDGLLDVITGKRYYAHPSTNPDPGTTDPAVISWFELQRTAAGATFVQHPIHTASGVGCNFSARDLNGDGKPDVFTSNKRGTFVHLQQ